LVKTLRNKCISVTRLLKPENVENDETKWNEKCPKLKHPKFFLAGRWAMKLWTSRNRSCESPNLKMGSSLRA